MKALILDKRAGTLALQVCRALARRGYEVDISGTPESMAFGSKSCAQSLEWPNWDRERVAQALPRIMAAGYDVIYVCNEEILELIASMPSFAPVSGLPMPGTATLRVLISKHETLKQVERNGIAVPFTLVTSDEREAEQASGKVQVPFIIKGERGQSGSNVRVVTHRKNLLPLYREVAASERFYGGRPAVQEMIQGAAYSVGGLFHNGRPLRICAHRKLLTYPPTGGVTVKGITERPTGLIDEAIKTFAVFGYTGLGHVEFIRDQNDGRFKFIEINPRVWGSIGIAEYAGVDFYRAYQQLASGDSIEPDLRYQEGVLYHRFSGELKLALKGPLRLAGFLRDAIDPRVGSDFTWSDPGPYLRSMRRLSLEGLNCAYRHIQSKPAS